ncbi:MAG TPA: DegV family protein [Anaerolineae bacterium]|nr:DegV family protein [Anaerolineae bacterium]
MENVRVVTDSLANIPSEMVEELGITVVPTNIHFGQEVYRNGIDLTSEEFYARLAKSPDLPTTSQPSVGVFEEVYRRLGRETDQIISLHIPATVSGTFNSAHTAAQALPHLEIAVVDGDNISMALGWLVVKAARAAQQGRDLGEIMALVQETIPRLRLLAVVDTLEYAYRGGRIGKSKALMGTLLRVKPIVQFLRGELLPVENVRTRRKALQRLVELAAEMAPFEEVAVPHTNAPEVAQEVREMLAAIHPVDRIPITEAGPVLGTHAGPGAVGIACVIRG